MLTRTLIAFIIIMTSCSMDDVKSVNTWGRRVNEGKQNLDSNLEKVSEDLTRINRELQESQEAMKQDSIGRPDSSKNLLRPE